MNENTTQLIFQKLQLGDDQAARQIFDQYATRLIALARSKLSEKLRRKLDPEDIVQSAMRTFFARAQNGNFEIQESSDLWALLATITRTKLLKKAEFYRQQKRDLDRDQHLNHSSNDHPCEMLATTPTDEEAVILADELTNLMKSLEPLPNQILELRLNGVSITEISVKVKRSERTVRRHLENLRETLEQRLVD